MQGPAESPPRMPRWVKAFIALGVALVLLLIAVAALGPGSHGPGRHIGGNGNEPSQTGTPSSGNTTTPAQGDREAARAPGAGRDPLR